MKNKYFLTALLVSLFMVMSFVPLYAQTQANTVSAYPAKSISGNDLCGATAQTECNLTNLKSMVSGLLSLFTIIGSVLLVLVIVVRLALSWWYRYTGKDANAIKKVGNDAFQSLIGFIIIFAIFAGGATFILKSFGVQDFILKLFSEAFVTHAYADTTGLLPNPTTMNNLYDILLSLARTIIRWFVYPSIVFMWLFSGFAYVYAQGKPEELKKAHSYTLLATIITIAVVMVQGFVFAVRNTALQVIGSSTVTTPAANTPATVPVVIPSATSNAAAAAALSQIGTSCTTSTGAAGSFVQGSAARDYAVYCSPTTPPNSNPCPLYYACTTTDGQPGTCVQGGASRDYAMYCSPTSPGMAPAVPSNPQTGDPTFIITPQ